MVVGHVVAVAADVCGTSVDGSNSMSQWYDVLNKPHSDAFSRTNNLVFVCMDVWSRTMQKCMFFAIVDVRQNFIISGILHGRRSYKVLYTRQASAAEYRMLENFTRKSNEQQWCPLDVSHCVVCVVCHDAAVEFVMVKRPNIESPKMNAIRHFIACTHQTGGGWLVAFQFVCNSNESECPQSRWESQKPKQECKRRGKTTMRPKMWEYRKLYE